MIGEDLASLTLIRRGRYLAMQQNDYLYNVNNFNNLYVYSGTCTVLECDMVQCMQWPVYK